MAKTKIGARFLGSTRGQIVSLLRGAARTVEELASALDLTDNAVRAHLATLERDGLVYQSGVRRGVRKPHATYALTTEAEDLFPKAYDTLFNVLLSVLKERLTPDELRNVLREVGRKVATDAMPSEAARPDLLAGAERAVKVLEALGGAPRLEREPGKITIQSTSCPLGTAVAAHPEVCRLAEALLTQLTGQRVRESCDKTSVPPHCLFEIMEKRKPQG